METRPPTTWEQKERDGLLALEIPEWREKRRIAEDPNTTSDVLAGLVRGDDYDAASFLLLVEAIVANPNVPPAILEEFVGWALLLVAPALCRNPVTPLLEWEAPGFWQRLNFFVCCGLLGEADLPASAVLALMQHMDVEVQEAAHLHVSQAAPLRTPADGCKALTKHWQHCCAAVAPKDEAVVKNWHAELVEVGFAPPCLTPFIPAAPPEPLLLEDNIREFHDREKETRDEFRSKPQTNPSPGTPEFEYLLTYLTRYYATPNEVMQAAQLVPTLKHSQVQTFSFQISNWFEIIAAHRNVSADILRFIIRHNPKDTASSLGLYLAGHPRTPPDVLVHLVEASPKASLHSADGTWLRRLAYHHRNAPPNIRHYGQIAFTEATSQDYHVTPLIGFLSALRPASDRNAEQEAKHAEKDWQSSQWVHRCRAALTVPAGAAANTALPNDEWGRTPRELLQHLAQDGNRFVRWAAQTRLAAPDFVFTWAGEEKP